MRTTHSFIIRCLSKNINVISRNAGVVVYEIKASLHTYVWPPNGPELKLLSYGCMIHQMLASDIQNQDIRNPRLSQKQCDQNIQLMRVFLVPRTY